MTVSFVPKKKSGSQSHVRFAWSNDISLAPCVVLCLCLPALRPRTMSLILGRSLSIGWLAPRVCFCWSSVNFVFCQRRSSPAPARARAGYAEARRRRTVLAGAPPCFMPKCHRQLFSGLPFPRIKPSPPPPIPLVGAPFLDCFVHHCRAPAISFPSLPCPSPPCSSLVQQHDRTKLKRPVLVCNLPCISRS